MIGSNIVFPFFSEPVVYDLLIDELEFGFILHSILGFFFFSFLDNVLLLEKLWEVCMFFCAYGSLLLE